MATDLNAILSGSAAPDPVPTPDPSEPSTGPEHTERPEESPDDGQDQGGEDPDAGDKHTPTPPVEEEEASSRVPVAALREERRKRQELEKRLAELEATSPQPPYGETDPVRARLDLSVEYAKEQFEDYETAETAFIDAVKSYPRGRELYQAMLADKHPARFAYEIGQQLMALNEIGDPRTYRQRVLSEAKAAAAPPKPPPSLPQTLAASRDSGGRFSPRDTSTSVATPLSEILAR